MGHDRRERGLKSAPKRLFAGLGGLEPLDTRLPPHAVVINLGQNDYGAGHTPSSSLWVAAYSAFVRNISATYGTSPEFFLACGGMDDKYCSDTQAAVRSMNAEGLQNVHYLDIAAARPAPKTQQP